MFCKQPNRKGSLNCRDFCSDLQKSLEESSWSKVRWSKVRNTCISSDYRTAQVHLKCDAQATTPTLTTTGDSVKELNYVSLTIELW